MKYIDIKLTKSQLKKLTPLITKFEQIKKTPAPVIIGQLRYSIEVSNSDDTFWGDAFSHIRLGIIEGENAVKIGKLARGNYTSL